MWKQQNKLKFAAVCRGENSLRSLSIMTPGWRYAQSSAWLPAFLALHPTIYRSAQTGTCWKCDEQPWNTNAKQLEFCCSVQYHLVLGCNGTCDPNSYCHFDGLEPKSERVFPLCSVQSICLWNPFYRSSQDDRLQPLKLELQGNVPFERKELLGRRSPVQFAWVLPQVDTTTCTVQPERLLW